MSIPYDKEIYLDYAASTPLDKEVAAHMSSFFDKSFGNPSSLHHRGRVSKKVINDARSTLAQSIGAEPDEIIFTSGGTEANNLALLGVARAYKDNGNHIIISAIEHASVMEVAYLLEKEGFKISIAPVTSSGVLDIDVCLSLITEKTILISIMLVNNEIGTVQPIKELSQLISKSKREGFPLLHTDACQASTLLKLNVSDLGVDLLTLNSGKIYGPAGVGLLYKKKGVKVEPLIVGGSQERGLRAGTESVPLIAGFAYAMELAIVKRDAEYIRINNLRNYMKEELKKSIPVAYYNGDEDNFIPSILHITLPQVEGESMLLMLDAYGICVSTGSACSANDLRPSHVLLALGQEEDTVHGSLRISFGRYTTKEEIDYFLLVFPGIVAKLSALSPVGLGLSV